jgi:hypothetical protein
VRRFDDGRFPLPPVRDTTGRGRAGGIRVGPNAAQAGTQRQIAFSVAPDLPVFAARRFAVGPHADSEATGRAGWRLIGADEGLGNPAVVYYPAAVFIDGFGRVHGGGERSEPAAAFGGWPVIVLIHGQTPEETGEEHGIPLSTSEASLCRGERLARDAPEALREPPLKLFNRWHQLQAYLARAGYVSLSPDVPIDQTSVVDVTQAFLDHSEWGALVDPGRLGLVGHSLGADAVNDAAAQLRPLGVAVLGPVGSSREAPTPGGVSNLYGPSATIGSDEDFNGGTQAVFLASRGPRHLVKFTLLGYSHYSYFDGLCHDYQGGTNGAAGRQRAVTRLALRRFFDRYLLGRAVPDDLGLDDPAVETDYSPDNGRAQ